MNKKLLVLGLLILFLSFGCRQAWELEKAMEEPAMPIMVTSIEITGESQVIVGRSITLSATVLPGSAAQQVVWSSSNPALATVDPNTGEVTGVAEGTVIITATSTDGSNVGAPYTVEVWPQPI